MSNLDTLIKDLVIANRILAKEDVVDAYGHVSVRNPDNPKHFFLSRSLAPELIEKDDIVELGMDGQPVTRTRSARSISSASSTRRSMEKHPDMNAVVHAHAEDILPFGIASRHAAQAGDPFRQLHRPERAGVGHRRQVRRHQPARHQHGRRAAISRRCMDGNPVALMRGHGFASAARSLIEVVRLSVYLPRNARALMRAKQLGGKIKYLSTGRDRRPQPRLQPLFERDLARLGILGEQGRLRPHADAAGRRPGARARPQARP